MMVQKNNVGSLPTAIAHKLRSVRNRHVALATTRGLAIGLGVLFIAMVVAMTIDWAFLLLSASLRTLLTSLALASGILTALVVVARAVRRVGTIRHAARTVDASLPSLQERWSTVESLSNQSRRSTSAEYRLMKDQLASEAVAMQSLVQPAKITPVSTLKKPLLGMAGCVVALIAFLAVYPQQTSILWQRFWSPTQNITATQLVDLNDFVLVPRGETVELKFGQEGLPRTRAELTIEYPGGFQETTPIDAEPEEKTHFVHTHRVDESFRFRMTAGDGRTSWNALKVIDYPEIGEVQFLIVAPSYVDREDVEKGFIPRRIKVIQGTKLFMAIKPKTPVQHLHVTATTQADSDVNAPETLEIMADQDGWYRYERLLDENVTIEPDLLSEHGLSNEVRTICRIQAIADQAPVARVIGPSDEAAVANDEVIEIEFEAHDDHGIAKAELVIYDDSKMDEYGEPLILETREIPLGDKQMSKHMVGSTKLDLNDLALEKDAQISYSIRVTDNRDADALQSEPDDKQTSPMVASTQPNRTEEPSGTRENDSMQELPIDSDESEKQMRGNPDASPTDMLASNKESGASETSTPDPSRNAPSKNKLVQPEPSDDLAATSAASEKTPTKKPPASNLAQAEPTKKDSEASDDTGRKPDRAAQSKPAAKNERETNPSKAMPEQEPADAMVSEERKNRGGQKVATNRRKLKITERLSAIATSSDLDSPKTRGGGMRERVVEIDKALEVSQTSLKALVDHSIPDSTRGDKLGELDLQMGSIEKVIADLRDETKEGEYAFVGLQMVDIGRFHLTPARDRVFAAIRTPNASDLDAKVAYGHVNRARVRLAKLLVRYDRVKQDRDYQEEIDEKIPMYEVYVEKSQQLLREAQQNRNPMSRAMSVVSVDQDYLDRWAEVLTDRREMLREFSEMLAEDPRLLSRYMELTRRRRNTMRDRLSDLVQRQDELTYESIGWLEIDEEQRDDLWDVVIELRIGAVDNLSNDIHDFVDRLVKQMPLAADPTRGTPLQIVRASEQMISALANLESDAEGLGQQLTSDQLASVREHSDELVATAELLDALLDQLLIENDNGSDTAEEFVDYVQPRLLEVRIVGAQCDSWAAILDAVLRQDYGAIAALEQHDLAVDAQRLRMDMETIQDELRLEFERQIDSVVPEQIVAFVNQLRHLMDSITMNQLAAVMSANSSNLAEAAKQQQLALERLSKAEELFDGMRRSVVRVLDEYQEPDPNIADLEDPTLDEFLARLERELNIAGELGIPRRKRNLRVSADSMLWQQNAQAFLGSSSESAAARANRRAKEWLNGTDAATRENEKGRTEEDQTMSKAQQQNLAEQKRKQEELEQSLVEIEAQAQANDVAPAEKRRLEKLANDIRELMVSSDDDQSQAAAWKRLVDLDQASALLKAISDGESVPDEQWNKLQSTLDDGLWQVRGKKPPQQYRKAIQKYQDSLRELVGQNDGV